MCNALPKNYVHLNFWKAKYLNLNKDSFNNVILVHMGTFVGIYAKK
jgi:hypothetical protein